MHSCAPSGLDTQERQSKALARQAQESQRRKENPSRKSVVDRFHVCSIPFPPKSDDKKTLFFAAKNSLVFPYVLVSAYRYRLHSFAQAAMDTEIQKLQTV
jgi:hypothetical protein